jgi:hypothetical protein
MLAAALFETWCGSVKFALGLLTEGNRGSLTRWRESTNDAETRDHFRTFPILDQKSGVVLGTAGNWQGVPLQLPTINRL